MQGGCIYGQGHYIYDSGDQYVGEFGNRKKHGQGTYTAANGDQYVGEYREKDWERMTLCLDRIIPQQRKAGMTGLPSLTEWMKSTGRQPFMVVEGGIQQ